MAESEKGLLNSCDCRRMVLHRCACTYFGVVIIGDGAKTVVKFAQWGVLEKCNPAPFSFWTELQPFNGNHETELCIAPSCVLESILTQVALWE